MPGPQTLAGLVLMVLITGLMLMLIMASFLAMPGPQTLAGLVLMKVILVFLLLMILVLMIVVLLKLLPLVI